MRRKTLSDSKPEEDLGTKSNDDIQTNAIKANHKKLTTSLSHGSKRTDENPSETQMSDKNTAEDSDIVDNKAPEIQKRKRGRPRGSKNRSTVKVLENVSNKGNKKYLGISKENNDDGHKGSDTAAGEISTDIDKFGSADKTELITEMDIFDNSNDNLLCDEVKKLNDITEIDDDDFQENELIEDFDEYDSGIEKFEDIQDTKVTYKTDSKPNNIYDSSNDNDEIIHMLNSDAETDSDCISNKKTEFQHEDDDKTVLLSSRLVYGKFIKQLKKECLNIYEEEIKRNCKKWKKMSKDTNTDTEKLIRIWSKVMFRSKADKHSKKEIKKIINRAAKKAWSKLCRSIDSHE